MVELNFNEKKMLLYEGGYIDSEWVDFANEGDILNLREDLLAAALTMDKEIEAGNFIEVDKQFLMNNLGVFRGIHEADHAKSVRRMNYVFNFQLEDPYTDENVSLIFDPLEKTLHPNDISVGLEPLDSFSHQFDNVFLFVPSLEQWGTHILNWTSAQLIQLLEKV